MTSVDTENRRFDLPSGEGANEPSTGIDQAFIELAAELCQVPIAVMGAKDGHGTWATQALGEGAGALPGLIDCFSVAAERGGVLLFDDARQDPRLTAHPLLAGSMGLAFCAALSLADRAGRVLGVLGLVDRIGRRLTEAQQQALQTLARPWQAQLEAREHQLRLERALQASEAACAALAEREALWRMLFERNPLPMWIYDRQSLHFLAVNEAAVTHYGWSRAEFADMTIRDIRPPEDLPALTRDLAAIQGQLRGAKAWRHRKKSGEIILVDVSAHSTLFEGREARLVLAHDVTASLRATQSLKESDSRWERLFAASTTGIAAAGMDGRLVRVNPAFCQLLGRDEAQLLGSPMLAFTHPDDAVACQRELDRLVAGEIESFAIEKRYLDPDGRARWARASVTLTAPEDGEARQFVAAVQDVDAQRRAQEDLNRHHALAAIAGKMARLGGWQVLMHPEPMVHWTGELREILEIPTGEVPSVEQGIAMYLPGSRERIGAAFKACVEEGLPFDLELEIRTGSGRLLQVRGIGTAMRDTAGRIIGAQGALLDQTERHAAQQALRRSEERFRSVARATADAVWDWDLVEGTVWRNDGVQTLFGYDKSALQADKDWWLSRVHADDRESVLRSLESAIGGTEDRWQADYRLARADGSLAYVLDRGFLIRDENGRAVRMVGGITDLSAQREAEQRLRRQAALLDAARDAIVVRDLEGRIQYWNRGAERLFGWSPAEAIGRRAIELLHEDEDQSAQSVAELLRRGEWAAMVQCRRRDGRQLTVDVRQSLLRDAEGRPEAVLAIKTDVTARVALESQLHQSQRLEAVGQLTGGVAHDFNNLLTVIMGNAELLAEMLADNPRLLPLAQMTASAAERGAQLTQRLLAFARKQPLQPQAVDAHLLLSDMDSLLRRTLPENIELQLVRAAGLWPVLADPVQLESAVLNLVLNARDAMPGGGKITLETANAWIDQDYAERHADVLPGQYTMLSISDTGVGMDAHTLAHAFEPFFTTKSVGKGTGLGLSMVYGFAKQSRGHVKLYSESGQGTTVRLYLPRADAVEAAVGAPHAAADVDLRGHAVVLVVEDDELVRRFATEMLRTLGYEVLAAEHGAAALELLRQRPDIALLFTDVVMPGGINGRQLADAARILRPELKVLFTSGYTENAIVHHGRLDRGVHLLSKPYRAVDLARKVRAVLG